MNYKKILFLFLITPILTIILVKSTPITLVAYDGPSMTGIDRNGDMRGIAWINDDIQINRGDYVIFNIPDIEDEACFAKRVIALGGETIDVINDNIYVNGELLEENYVNSERKYDIDRNIYDYYIPKGETFVLGDFRTSSYDSSELGPISNDYIYGKIILTELPFSIIRDKFNLYFNNEVED